jgi:predicted nucleotidyltransferase
MSIASALFTESQRRLFAWLFGHPDRSFHLNELRRLTGLGSASIQRELARLTESGLILSEKVGNLRRFRASPDSPVFAELINLTRKTLGVVPVLESALAPLSSHLQGAFVFGSVARQADTASSDIDLMIVSDDMTLGALLEHLLPAERQLGRTISPTCYTRAEFDRRRTEADSFVNRVLSQPILWLAGRRDEFERSG